MATVRPIAHRRVIVTGIGATAWQAHMQPAAMLRGLVNPRDSTESELGLWFAFLRDTVRNSMGLVAAEVWH